MPKRELLLSAIAVVVLSLGASPSETGGPGQIAQDTSLRPTAQLHQRTPWSASRDGTKAFDQDVIVYTAHQGWLSRIYVMRMDGTVLNWFAYDFYLWADVEVVNGEVFVAEAFAPRIYQVDIETGALQVIVDDWSLYYLYDVAFDGQYLYTVEWDLNKYTASGQKIGTTSFGHNVNGGAWAGNHWWTLTDTDRILCWDVSGWPTVTELPGHAFDPPSPDCRGLWYDGEHFWTAESIDGALGWIYEFDEKGAVIRQIREPAFRGWGACVVEAPLFELSVAPDPLQSGQSATFTVTGGQPLSATFLVYSLVGPGSFYVPPPFDVTLGLDSPELLAATFSDDQGDAFWNLSVPPGTAGLDVWFQAAQFGRVTNVVATSIQ